MRRIAIVVFALCTLAAPVAWALPAPADDITNFHDDFRTTGWTYRWNKGAALGSQAVAPVGNAAYSDLVFDSGDNKLKTDGSDAAASNLFVSNTSLFPGKALGQDGTAYERYAMISYTIQASDIPDPGAHPFPFIWLRTYSFALAANANQTDGINARFYVDNFEASAAAYGGPIALGASDGFNDSLYGPFPLGPAAVGTTITFAIGASGPQTYPPFGGPNPSGVVSNDAFDQVNLNFTLAISDPPPGVPEPTTLSAVAFGALALMRRRRRAM